VDKLLLIVARSTRLHSGRCVACRDVQEYGFGLAREVRPPRADDELSELTVSAEPSRRDGERALVERELARLFERRDVCRERKQLVDPACRDNTAHPLRHPRDRKREATDVAQAKVDEIQVHVSEQRVNQAAGNLGCLLADP
jgi:hypothetical protein